MNGDFTFEAKFSEPVAGFTVSDISVSDTDANTQERIENFTANNAGDTYTGLVKHSAPNNDNILVIVSSGAADDIV